MKGYLLPSPGPCLPGWCSSGAGVLVVASVLIVELILKVERPLVPPVAHSLAGLRHCGRVRLGGWPFGWLSAR